MYTHIAIFKWKSGTKISAVNSVLREIKALENKISGIEISIAENRSKYSQGYTHVILIRGKGKEAIEAYRKHSAHQIVATKIEAMEEHGIGVDFETE